MKLCSWLFGCLKLLAAGHASAQMQVSNRDQEESAAISCVSDLCVADLAVEAT
jgi:hypothetical protein